MVSYRAQVGDVFLIPCDDMHVGVGQVVAKYGNDAYYMVVFATVLAPSEVPARIPQALAGEVLFIALSMDAKLHAGHWRVVERAPVRGDLPLPAYKEAVATGDHIDVVDFSGTRRRRARREELDRLGNRKVVAPIRLVRAMRASLGLEPWLDAFDELKPHGATTHEIFS